MRATGFLVGAAVVVAAGVVAVLAWPSKEGLVVYVAHDEEYASPMIAEFERETGIAIRDAQYDTEANKTIGLVNRLLEERENPRCDVFWNNEVLHTIRLTRAGVLEPYVSPSAADVPAEFKDPDGHWTGFAARARVLIVHGELAAEGELPDSMYDLVDPRWKGRGAFARPLTGTTLTHALVLFTVLGEKSAVEWFEGLHANDAGFPPSNGQLAKAVGLGQYTFGFTDTDDFRKQVLDGKPVRVVYPDQAEGRPGTLLIPNTVALVRGGKRPDLGKQLIDWLLRKEVEARLAAGGAAQIPVRADVPRPDHVKGPPAYRVMKVDWNDVAEHADERIERLEALWSR